jgi:hypothetical protein
MSDFAVTAHPVLGGGRRRAERIEALLPRRADQSFRPVFG